MEYIKRILFGTLLTVFLFGCSASQQQRGSQTATLHKRIDELQRGISKLGERLESVSNDVMILQDQMESTRIQVQKFEHHGPKKAAKIAARKAKKKASKPYIYIKSSEAPKKKKQLAADSPLGQYKKAFGLYEKGKLNEALELFENFVKNYPKHDYADNAIYWMGEAYYDQKEFLLAITEFRRVIKKYPQSNKLADALLKIGYSYESLDDDTRAKGTFVKLLEDYPYTAAAEKAATRLAKLSNR